MKASLKLKLCEFASKYLSHQFLNDFCVAKDFVLDNL